MKQIEKLISPTIESQFPSFYAEEGPMFIAFVKAYYQWLESEDRELYHGRRLPEYRDIDYTLDRFIVHFKEKYLTNIQFTTASNKKLFIKNALDFYRSKGTERSIELFFKLIYALPVSVYTPGDDLFKLSSGHWEKPTYLEVTHKTKNIEFVGKQIVGVNTGAKAFVERLVRKKSKGRTIDLLFISSVDGLFRNGEMIRYDSNINNNPTVIGSLTECDIIVAGSGFEIGESVKFISDTGSYGKAIVSSISNSTGTVDFNLIEGGFGFNTNSQILMSDHAVSVSNVRITTLPDPLSFYFPFVGVSQQIANVQFDTATGDFTEGETIVSYNGGSIDGSGTILKVEQTSSESNGSLLIAVASGNLLTGNILYTDSNTITANIATYTDQTATANAIGISSRHSIQVGSIVGNGFNIGDIVIQSIANNVIGTGSIISVETIEPLVQKLNVANVNGFFLSNTAVSTSTTSANVRSVGFTLGVTNTVNQFYETPTAKLVSSPGSIQSTIERVRTTNGASFSLGEFTSNETYKINYTDNLVDYQAVALNATAYGFPLNPSANLTSDVLDDILGSTTRTIGSIATLSSINRGSGYSDAPYVLVFDQQSHDLNIRDNLLTIENPTKSFVVGEFVVGSISGNRALLKAASSTSLQTKRRSVVNQFLSGELIIGESSAAQATLVQISDLTGTSLIGLNSIITTDVQTSQGAVASLDVVDSGIGYVDLESMTFYSTKDSNKTGTVVGHVTNQGIGEGFYKYNGGFLSADKYIHDGTYYQEYSYEILTALPFDQYSDMFKKVVHVAGTKLFGTYQSDTTVAVPSSINQSMITIE